MNRLLFLTLLTSYLLPLTSYVLPLHAASGPKWLKVANKSIVRLHALQEKGDTIEANAFFVDNAGQLLAPLKAIQSAQSAWTVDASGKRLEVSHILGYNATYDIVRLQAEAGKKGTVALPVASEAPTNDETLYLAPSATTDAVRQTEKAGDYNYYTLGSAAKPEWAGLPVVNEMGQVVAVLQTPVTIAKAPNYALDVRLPLSLEVKSIDVNNADLRNCQIPLKMPDGEEQALSFLYLANATGNPLRMVYIEEFIRRYPTNASGYIQKADQLCAAKQYDAAFQTYETALGQQAAKHDEILYARARNIYNVSLQPEGDLPQQWTLEQALADIKAAEAANPLPLYTLQEASIRYALKQYEEAYKGYMAVTQTNMRSAETFLYAWQCQQSLGAEPETLLALNDSALACFAKPYNESAAPYLLLRSNTLTEVGRLRDAITDLNDYEHLMQGRLTAQFYYQREQLETRARLFSPAVNDIHKAISLAPEEPVFYAELAALLYRLNDVDSALEECRKAIAIDPEFPDAYRLLGICLREKGRTAEAQQNLQKAIELGDTMASGILDNMTKK